jgi:hypothetical protein
MDEIRETFAASFGHRDLVVVISQRYRAFPISCRPRVLLRGSIAPDLSTNQPPMSTTTPQARKASANVRVTIDTIGRCPLSPGARGLTTPISMMRHNEIRMSQLWLWPMPAYFMLLIHPSQFMPCGTYGMKRQHRLRDQSKSAGIGIQKILGVTRLSHAMIAKWRSSF